MGIQPTGAEGTCGRGEWAVADRTETVIVGSKSPYIAISSWGCLWCPQRVTCMGRWGKCAIFWLEIFIGTCQLLHWGVRGTNNVRPGTNMLLLINFNLERTEASYLAIRASWYKQTRAESGRNLKNLQITKWLGKGVKRRGNEGRATGVKA
jgi:hypothetical protein